jgi:uncharacterized protein YidB (DUF937 family)
MLQDLIKNIGGQFGLGDKAGDLFSILAQQIQNQGGLQGLLAKFQESGLQDQVASWLGQGENHPITAQQAHAALGDTELSEMSDKLGMPKEQVAEAVSALLPEMVNKMTPDGQVPKNHDFLSSLQELAGGFDLSQVSGMLGGLLGSESKPNA